MCWSRFLLPSCLHTAYTQLTTFYIHLTHPTLTLYTLYARPIHTLHSLCAHSTHTLDTPYTHPVHTLHTICTRPAHSLHSLYTRTHPPPVHVFTTHTQPAHVCLPFTHPAYILHVSVFALRTPPTLTLHTLHMCAALHLTHAQSTDCKTSTPSATCQVNWCVFL